MRRGNNFNQRGWYDTAGHLNYRDRDDNRFTDRWSDSRHDDVYINDRGSYRNEYGNYGDHNGGDYNRDERHPVRNFFRKAKNKVRETWNDITDQDEHRNGDSRNYNRGYGSYNDYDRSYDHDNGHRDNFFSRARDNMREAWHDITDRDENQYSDNRNYNRGYGNYNDYDRSHDRDHRNGNFFDRARNKVREAWHDVTDRDDDRDNRRSYNRSYNDNYNNRSSYNRENDYRNQGYSGRNANDYRNRMSGQNQYNPADQRDQYTYQNYGRNSNYGRYDNSQRSSRRNEDTRNYGRYNNNNRSQGRGDNYGYYESYPSHDNQAVSTHPAHGYINKQEARGTRGYDNEDNYGTRRKKADRLMRFDWE
jgi:hypothetical protein